MSKNLKVTMKGRTVEIDGRLIEAGSVFTDVEAGKITLTLFMDAVEVLRPDRDDAVKPVRSTPVDDEKDVAQAFGRCSTEHTIRLDGFAYLLICNRRPGHYPTTNHGAPHPGDPGTTVMWWGKE